MVNKKLSLSSLITPETKRIAAGASPESETRELTLVEGGKADSSKPEQPAAEAAAENEKSEGNSERQSRRRSPRRPRKKAKRVSGVKCQYRIEAPVAERLRVAAFDKRVTARTLAAEALTDWLEEHGESNDVVETTTGKRRVAMVNTTYRFDEKLASRFEKVVEKRDEVGVSPRDHQSIINAALEVWLTKNGYTAEVAERFRVKVEDESSVA